MNLNRKPLDRVIIPEEEKPFAPFAVVQHDIQFTKDPPWPRVYHKNMSYEDKKNFYGNEVADASEGNVYELDFLPLNAQQEDYLEGEQRN